MTVEEIARTIKVSTEHMTLRLVGTIHDTNEATVEEIAPTANRPPEPDVAEHG